MNERDIIEESIPEQLHIRREKRRELLASGREPYPVSFPRSITLHDLRAKYGELPADTATGDAAAVAGRVIFLRNTGKLCFARIREGDGTELQIMLSLHKVGADSLAEWKSFVDIGDHIGIIGEVVSSKRGELSVLADEWRVTAKALRPLPVAHKPMTEESRVRQRYVDLIVREQARRTVRERADVLRSLRESFHRRGFIEVETPMLQVMHGGAAARPFVTHINAYDMELFLRIAPELYLKRCVVGGIEKVFEINRNFRNEGADSSHSPEFAMLECYEAYGDYETMATLTRELVQGAARSISDNTEVVTHADGTTHDLSGQWTSVPFYTAVSSEFGEDISPETPRERLVVIAEKTGISVQERWGAGKIAEELFDHRVAPTLQNPTFVMDYPLETAPLTRQHRSTSGLAEKWDLYINGFELATAYSELVDPVVQRERFVQQAALAAAGDDEAMRLDEDFLRAMEYGMPPSGGMGMGIDRLLMALTGLGIRETILFPLVKPES